MGRKVAPRVILGFLIPGLLIYGYFFFIPMVNAFYFSLTKWNGFSSEKVFIGIGNFKKLFVDPIFKIALQNTFSVMIFGGILNFGLCLLFTYLITKKGFKGRKFFSNLFYLPNMISQAALAIVWVFVFNADFGFANLILGLFGVSPTDWLSSRPTGIACLIFASSFAFVGFYLTLLLSGHDRIPDTYNEAAKIDGAGNIECFFKITIPLLREVMITAVVLWIITIIKYFELIYSMFRGNATNYHTMGTYMFSKAFGTRVPIFELGYACAIAVAMFVLVVIFTGLILKLFSERENIQY